MKGTAFLGVDDVASHKEQKVDCDIFLCGCLFISMDMGSSTAQPNNLQIVG